MDLAVTAVGICCGEDVSSAHRTARTLAGASGLSRSGRVRFATAVHEIVRNALQYAGGGLVSFSFDDAASGPRLMAVVTDGGTGIDAIDDVLRGRFSMHEGAGMGISGSRRLVDVFRIDTGASGTTVHLGMRILGGPAAEALADLCRASLRRPTASAAGRDPDEERDIRDALSQQQFLLREVHHRTKNNLAVILSMARLQGSQEDSPAARDALAKLSGRIQTFAQAHANFHQADGSATVDIGPHVADIVRQLANVHRGALDVCVDVPSFHMDFDAATELGLVLNELLSNAARHASPATGGTVSVKVSMTVTETEVEFSVGDDGPGIVDPGKTLERSRSLGWKIVQGSARKLGAELSVDGSDGLLVSLTMPRPAAA